MQASLEDIAPKPRPPKEVDEFVKSKILPRQTVSVHELGNLLNDFQKRKKVKRR